MNQQVQLAIDAANRGENNKALEILKQALAANPNDVDAWLVVAAIVEQPERKRQCLNRVLTLDPTNQLARDELLEMDRAALGGTPLYTPEPAPQSTYQSPAPSYPTSTSAFEPEPISAPTTTVAQPQAKTDSKSSSSVRLEKPLVFKYPIFWRLLMYFILAFFGCVGLLVATQNIINSLPFFFLALIMVLVIMLISPKVEVSETGIRSSSVFSSSEAKWKDIKRIQSGGMSQRLDLYKSNGEIVRVSAQVSGYPRIVEILRQKRPDLFGMVVASSAMPGNQLDSGSYGNSVPAPAFTGSKVFKKSAFSQYAGFFLYIPVCLLSFWAMLADPENQVGALILGIACLGLMIFSLFQINAIKVEPNRLTVQTMFGEKDFSAREIREIKIQSVRRRYGNVTTFVVVSSVQGKKYSLMGFSEGTEIIYGFLTNWWSTYKSK